MLRTGVARGGGSVNEKRWISVRGWRRFQHYDPAKRQPPWIKAYTELMSDDAYLGLSLRLRGILHGIWLAYAESRCALGANPVRLGLILGDSSVRTRDLARLNHAGFIEFVASKALAEGYRSRARVETETEKEEERGAVRSKGTQQHLDYEYILKKVMP
jgi:hypothetical protein